MHCVHLGNMKVHIGTVFWRLLLASIFGLKLSTQGDIVSFGLHNIMIILAEWYPKKRDRRGPQESQVTRVGNVAKGMIGSKASPSMSTKAAKSKWLFFFLLFGLVDGGVWQ
eukprot:1652053-Pyramimonas_sp.AAC.1